MAPSDPIPARPAAPWRPVGGALAASAALHALVFAALAAILLRPDGSPAPASVAVPLATVLVATPAPAESRAVAVAAAAPAPPPRASAPRIPIPPVAASASLPPPWSVAPIDTSLPWHPAAPGRPRLDAGVEIAEMRNVALLGEDIERRIQRGFDVEADLPMTLKSGAELGYPIDALDAGVEGRVLVWFAVDEAGNVVDREGLDGPQALRDWVLERLDQVIDKRARNKNDEGVRAWAALEVTFTREAAEDARNRLAAEPAAARSPERGSTGVR